LFLLARTFGQVELVHGADDWEIDAHKTLELSPPPMVWGGSCGVRESSNRTFQSLPETAIIASFKSAARCIPAGQKSPARVFGLDREAG
jgi:hypothetical protein